MTNIYIGFLFNVLYSNGLTDYIKELTDGLEKHKNIKLHHVWINRFLWIIPTIKKLPF